MKGRNICFRCEIRKNIFELSSIPPIIWSSAGHQNETSLLVPYVHPFRLRTISFYLHCSYCLLLSGGHITYPPYFTIEQII